MKKYHQGDLSNLSFLITGGAGFIGSNLAQYLIENNAKKVRVLDNLSNGYKENIQEYLSLDNFEFIEGDIRDIEMCKLAMEGMNYVSHQAALGSVPRSIDDPASSNEVNVSGFLNILIALKDCKTVKRLVYAASGSTYGDNETLPKVEHIIGKPLSPYAVTKYVNELYADVFGKTYNTDVIGLRYFNVFGPKQSPNGPYAAVVPSFMNSIKNDKPATINGDGLQTRDFTFVENVVQANIKSMFAQEKAKNEVYNVACSESISVNYLWETLNQIAGKNIAAIHGPSRLGDVRDSLADISKIKRLIDYDPKFTAKEGLKIAWNYFEEKYS